MGTGMIQKPTIDAAKEKIKNLLRLAIEEMKKIITDPKEISKDSKITIIVNKLYLEVNKEIDKAVGIKAGPMMNDDKEHKVPEFWRKNRDYNGV